MSATDWRGLCEELVNELQGYASANPYHDSDALVSRARAALAAEPVGEGPTDDELWDIGERHLWTGTDESVTNYRILTSFIEAARAVLSRYGHQPAPPAQAEMVDGPAVPEGREPASVVGEPSDENCWQWYTYCPEEGLEMYSDRKQAQSAAQSIMGSYEVAAHSDGWHEDMESVSWGMLVPVEQAQVVERKAAEPDDEFDEWVKYELRPARYGYQPAPPAAVAPGPTMEGVGPLIAWLTEQAHQAADASQPTDAGMLTWAAQVIGERVDEDVPAPPAATSSGEKK